MKILAFDTSTAASVIALIYDKKVITMEQTALKQQSQLLLPKIHEMLTSESLSIDDIDTIVFGCGPGSFTGIRVAASLAQGLSFATTKKLIPISSLAILGQTAFLKHGWKSVCIAVDAHMGNIYWAHYMVNKDNIVRLNGEEKIIKPSHLPQDIEIKYGLGNGWAKYQAILIDQLGYKPEIESDLLPSAQALVELAESECKKGHPGIRVEDIRPNYLQ